MVKLFPLTMIRDWKVATPKTVMAAVSDIICSFIVAYSLKKTKAFVAAFVTYMMILERFFSLKSMNEIRYSQITLTSHHDKVCFLFNNTDSHISRLTATFIFQAFERRRKHNNI